MSRKISILYIDDEPINLMLFEEIFSLNYNVVTSESGFDGLKILRSSSDINVVISDMKMPGMNGLEFISEAKKEFPNCNYYILTGYNITPQISEALDNKLILGYFCKPLNVDEIEASIRKEFG